ncbi:hypothetical protein DL93DRAFT_2087622 [Clavulina sp. PMI_390]|nr:hypothetical protein DL93DRAFT_2087622 [Clavulina sp. PMI_390]
MAYVDEKFFDINAPADVFLLALPGVSSIAATLLTWIISMILRSYLLGKAKARMISRTTEFVDILGEVPHL